MKYVGSKSAIAKQLAPEIQAFIQPGSGYVEPFVGGANLITHIRAGERTGADSNEYLIALLTALRDGWEPERISRQCYLEIKRNPASYPAHLVGWAGVCCSYSGKWFDGYAGVVETKNGVRDYIAEAIKNCKKQSPALRGIMFQHSDYRDLQIKDGSLVYCDPPYRQQRRLYKDSFDSDEFFNWAENLSDRCTVLVSEHAAPAGWREVWSRERGSSLSANGSEGWRKRTVEKLFTFSQRVTRDVS
jgi:DNA adenine methylase